MWKSYITVITHKQITCAHTHTHTHNYHGGATIHVYIYILLVVDWFELCTCWTMYIKGKKYESPLGCSIIIACCYFSADSDRLFFRNVPTSVTLDMLKEVFIEAESIKIITDKNRVSKG